MIVCIRKFRAFSSATLYEKRQSNKDPAGSLPLGPG